VQLGPHPQIARTAISPDGRWVATSTYWGVQSTIKVWDAITGQLVRDLPGEGHNGDARVAFSPDGRWLVLGTPREYRFHEVGSWQPGRPRPRERADASVAPLAFAPDGSILAILQNPRLVQLIDVARGEELASLVSSDPWRIGHLAFSPDGSQISAACGDGVIQVWNLRYLRQQLADLGLDWDLPPYPPPDDEHQAKPLEIRVDLGKPGPPAKPPEPGKTDKLRQDVDEQTRAIARNPGDAEAHSRRGRLYYLLNEFAKARDDLDRAIALQPDHSEAHHYRGHVHERSGQAQKAIDDFSAALEGQPRNAHLYYARGRNLMRLEDYAKALEDLNRALELGLPSKSEQASVCNGLAWIQVAGPMKFRDPDKALPLAQKAVGLAPDNRAYCHTLGVVQYRLGRYTKAVAALEQAVKNNKGQATAFDLYFLAMCHHHLDDAARARDCYDRAIAGQKKARLRPEQIEGLNAFRAEAEALLKPGKP
jgi:tetratricopeptide (TPR) repeat protein